MNVLLLGLILTGWHHPGHPWQETTAMMQKAFAQNSRFKIEVSENIEDLSQLDLKQFDFLVLNYCNWEKPGGLSDASKKALVNYLKEGGGLIIIHFANGAWHHSLPGAGESDWPGYRKICRRVWDHDSTSSHDPHGKFTVHIADTRHYITRGLNDFTTRDELYYNQIGDEPVGDPLITAHSKNTGREEPLAWAYRYGKGRVFLTLLGHDGASFEASEVQEMLRRGAEWVAGY